MNNENSNATVSAPVNVQAISSAVAKSIEAFDALQVAEAAVKAARATFSDACEAAFVAIPGDNKSVNKKVNGVSRRLTYTKTAHDGFTCRGIKDKAAVETLDLDV